MRCRIHPIDLELKREFTIAGGRAAVKRNYIFIIDDLGLGEASGSVKYGPSPDKIKNDLHLIAEVLSNARQDDVESILANFTEPICAPAICAATSAFADWAGKKRRMPLHECFHLPAPSPVKTSVTVSIGDTGALSKWIQSGYNIIKLKTGADDVSYDSIIDLTQEYKKAVFRIDANGSWDYDYAARITADLPAERIELIEQPFLPEDEDSWNRLKEKTDIPLFMDESICTADDVKRVARYVDGVNIKIQKSGRLETALKAMKEARRLDLKIMLGCMIESSVGIAAAYHLAAPADYFDLDGRLLVKEDEFVGLDYRKGYLIISNDFGHGVTFV